jgi:hypothetical protein
MNLIDAISPARATLTSITAAYTGSVISVFSLDIFLQRAAWIVAIIAGFVAIYNGSRQWFKKRKQ